MLKKLLKTKLEGHSTDQLLLNGFLNAVGHRSGNIRKVSCKFSLLGAETLELELLAEKPQLTSPGLEYTSLPQLKAHRRSR